MPSSVTTSLLEYALGQNAKLADDERLQIGRKALLAYDGYYDPALKIKPGDPDDNVTVNYASVIVDKGASFLFGQDLVIGIGDQKSTAEEDELEELWPLDQRSEDLLDLATNGGIFGHAWAKIALTDGQPEVIVLDPQNMSAEWSRSSYKEIRKYRNQYNTVDENNKPIVWREEFTNEGDHWVIQEYYSAPGSLKWIAVGPPVMWVYPFAPVFQCKNLPKPNEFYGRADLSKYVLSLIHYIGRVDSLINRILRIHAYPKAVAIGIRKQDLQVGVDETLFLPDKEQELKLLEMSGDLEQARNFRKQMREALSEVSHVPEVVTSKTEDIGQLSGRAIRILYGPLVDQTERKRRLYGRMLKELASAILVIGGGTEQVISLSWPDPLPADDKEKADTAVTKKQIGVSEDTLLRELGYDPKHEREMKKLDQQDLGSTLLRQFDRGLPEPPAAEDSDA